MNSPLFDERFRLERRAANGIEITVRHGGEGPPLLLLHGFPQTHASWHRVAPQLAQHDTRVMPGLRGYGGSAKPPSDGARELLLDRMRAFFGDARS
jgi:haloacetate dehalogenase